jgi:vacuolar-type H+-ATPase subunit H
MTQISLHDVLKAEKEAGERIRKAHEDADRIRRDAEKRIADLDKQVNARIDAKRRERMAQVVKEIEAEHKAALAEADKAIAGWQAKYDERCRAIIERIAAILSGKSEG